MSRISLLHSLPVAIAWQLIFPFADHCFAQAQPVAVSDPWIEQSKIHAADGTARDFFGLSVALDQRTALIGALFDDAAAESAGSVYFFESISGGWKQVVRQEASDADVHDLFGVSVALHGDTALIGAYGDDDSTGSAYVFERDAWGEWSETQKLVASDGAVDDHFGKPVLLSDGTALVGAFGDDDLGTDSGSAYVFERGNDGVWVETQKLTAADGSAEDHFGRFAALDGDMAIIAAPRQGPYSGAAYVFQRDDNGAWGQVQRLVGSGANANALFGWSVALSGDTALIASLLDDERAEDAGAVYVFEKADGIWWEVQKLTAADGGTQDALGESVALCGDTAVAGTRNDDAPASNSGSAYVYRRIDGSWVQIQKLTASDGDATDSFGADVALSGAMLLIGAYGDEDLGAQSGSAYLFRDVSLTAVQPLGCEATSR